MGSLWVERRKQFFRTQNSDLVMTAKKPLQRILIIASAISFFGSTGYTLAQMFNGGFQSPEETTELASLEQQLQEQARGYELVLQREPENSVALQGLVDARLQMNDWQGAIAPLEKLVKLQPQQVEYQALLTEVMQVEKEGDRSLGGSGK